MPDVKGNPYRFTLLFNQNDQRHRRAVEILNQQGKSKASTSSLPFSITSTAISCQWTPPVSTSPSKALPTGSLSKRPKESWMGWKR